MLAKNWKQIGFLILIIAVLFNITLKLINKTSLKTEIIESAQYMLEQAKNGKDESMVNENAESENTATE